MLKSKCYIAKKVRCPEKSWMMKVLSIITQFGEWSTVTRQVYIVYTELFIYLLLL